MPTNEYKDAQQSYCEEDHTTLQVLKAEFNAYQKVVDAHLIMLNGEAGRIATAAELFLRKDVYEERQKSLEISVSDIQKRQNAMELWQSGVLGRTAMLMLVIGVTCSILGAILEHTFLH